MRLCAVAVLTASTSLVQAQNLISAKSGLVHYVEGDVLVAGKPVERKLNLFTTVKPGELLTTGEGRAEVLLGPGVFLRISEKSIVRMVNAELSDTRVELVSGAAIVEAADTIKENKTTVVLGSSSIALKKEGIYSLTADPATVRVWTGEIAVVDDGRTLNVKGGRELALAGMAVTKFKSDETDSLYRWAKRRSGYIALANISGARRAEQWGVPISGYSGWYFNPWFNMFTFIPTRGIWNSPFGYRFFSPGAVVWLYQPGGFAAVGGGSRVDSFGRSVPSWNSDLGYATVPTRSSYGVSSGGYSGGGYSGGGGYAGGAAAGGGGSAAGGRAAAGGGAAGGGGGRGGQ